MFTNQQGNRCLQLKLLHSHKVIKSLSQSISLHLNFFLTPMAVSSVATRSRVKVTKVSHVFFRHSDYLWSHNLQAHLLGYERVISKVLTKKNLRRNPLNRTCISRSFFLYVTKPNPNSASLWPNAFGWTIAPVSMYFLHVPIRYGLTRLHCICNHDKKKKKVFNSTITKQICTTARCTMDTSKVLQYGCNYAKFLFTESALRHTWRSRKHVSSLFTTCRQNHRH